MVNQWIGEFKWGRMSTNDTERLGRPKEVTALEIIKKIYGILQDDPKVKVHELAEAAGTLIGWVKKSLHEKANRKICKQLIENANESLI